MNHLTVSEKNIGKIYSATKQFKDDDFEQVSFFKHFQHAHMSGKFTKKIKNSVKSLTVMK